MLTIQGKTGDPIQLKGHFSSILTREGNDWKIRMSTWNVTPAPTAPEAGRTQRIQPGNRQSRLIDQDSQYVLSFSLISTLG